MPGQKSADARYIYFEGEVYTSYQLHLEPFWADRTDYLRQQITPLALTSPDANVTPETMLTPARLTLTRGDWTVPVEIQHLKDTSNIPLPLTGNTATSLPAMPQALSF